GVVIILSPLPGGTASPHNLGQPVTGLACVTPSNDEVSDTPAEYSAAFGCPTRDTCSSAGVDPIHNFMDYTDDSCMTEFTAGQVTRLRLQIATSSSRETNFTMHFRNTAFALFLAASTVLGRKCGTTITDAQVKISEAHFKANQVTVKAKVALAPIDVYFHAISSGSTLSTGYVPESQIRAQVDVLNEDFASTGRTFVLQNITRTVNANWFNSAGPSNSYQTAMKNALRQGDKSTLNIYSVGFQSSSTSGLLGYATFPSSYNSAPKDDGVGQSIRNCLLLELTRLISDTLVLLFSSLPGGTTTNYNLGQTGTHEVGHWVGLYHTFQGGCSGSGDSVSDTPAEASAASGCPIGRDTCSSAGVDPIHNFMDYSYDSCMTEFTSGQTTRMNSQLATYRGI
ncbi:hypothetical protein CVT25_008713, partial [Psilocybe cyanescens]